MSEPILMALVQLFAIISASVKKLTSDNSRTILESYLRHHLNSQELDEYLKLFDELRLFHLDDGFDLTSDQIEISGKIRNICEGIRKQLPARDRLIVFIKFLEFIGELSPENNDKPTIVGDLSEKYLQVIKEVFNLTEQEVKDSKAFIFHNLSDDLKSENILAITASEFPAKSTKKHIYREHLTGQILILYFPLVKTLILRYLGNDELYMNGHTISPYRTYVFNSGAIIKNPKIKPLYHTDVVSQFLHSKEKIKIEFTANEIEYQFKNSDNGIQPFSFTATSGELIGVMGGSGVGKSTLLNVLNGNLPLKNGNIFINGYDLEKDKEKLRGVIGFVPQDDLLIEELTVFQNLYYNAKLCFRNFTEIQLIRSVLKVLIDIDLIGIKNLTVGDPINKFISGGQRKRLNIALELIREPAILFADEPTSGLSSMDSDMVMLLLKEQTIKGRLVIVNIHQPSSDIYKLFDKLLVMDKGGYPVYYGNPIDALAWFKTASYHVNPDESECQECGYVNPEQLLQIIESKIVNNHGQLTNVRKKTPKEWYELFKKNSQPHRLSSRIKTEIPKSYFKIPGIFKQFRIFSIRNVLTKITNRQYILINLLEGPLLASLLAFLSRYHSGDTYLMGNNPNLVPYLFMSVVVSLFLGMMVSAEEIIKDRRILKREAFLNLSRFSYLNSKMALLFVLSAIQTILYVVVGNLILGIHGMTFSYWLILFTTSCFANMVGLNISSGLDSVVAIYILIPFILIPQLLLSGAIVPFDKLNPSISSRENVPLVGNLMASRWSFEALAVEQFKNNRYEKVFYQYDKELSHYAYLTAYVIPTLKSELDICQRNIFKDENGKETANYLEILKNEIPLLEQEVGFKSFPLLSALNEKQFNDPLVHNTKLYLDSLSRRFSIQMNAVSSKRDAAYEKLRNKLGNDEVYKFKQTYYNESIADLVLNKMAEDKIIEGKGILIRKKDPVFTEPSFHDGRASLYAPVKFISSWEIDTLWFNVAIIWLMSLVLYFTLLYNLLRRVITWFGNLNYSKK